jgi:ABC-type Fe3+-citrate transport system substrate-binding protein
MKKQSISIELSKLEPVDKLNEYERDFNDDIELTKIVNQRLQELEEGKSTTIRVNIDDL